MPGKQVDHHIEKQILQILKTFIIMNSLRNRVQLIGHLGMDPEVKTLESNKKVARFSLATNDEYNNKEGEKVKETQWHQIVVWGKLAETCEKFLTRGKEVALEGKLTYRNWTDKDGVVHYITEVIANEILFIGNKS
jgi:single-strand DNA-binding protein